MMKRTQPPQRFTPQRGLHQRRQMAPLPDYLVELVDVTRLPIQLRWLCRVIGMRAALDLAMAYGGTRIDVPARATPKHPLCEVIGYHALACLVEAVTMRNSEGEAMRLDMTSVESVMRQLRRKQIAYMTERGSSEREVALATGYTQRSVRMIRAELRTQAQNPAAPARRPYGYYDTEQFDLFEHINVPPKSV